MLHSYLIRYGLMGQVGKFAGDSAEFERGRVVVVRSHRGTELGEVLAGAPPSAGADLTPASARVLRVAGPDDLERARQAELDRSERYAICRQVFENGVWPLELIDVEPLLDNRRTVLHYLGPHRLDVAGLLAAFRTTCDLDVMLEPVGRDVPDDEPEPNPEEHAGCGQCGSAEGGCGSGGGECGSCDSSSHGGCSDCGVKKLIAASRAVASR